MTFLIASLLFAIAGQNATAPAPSAPAQEPLPLDWAPVPKRVYTVRLAVDIPIIVLGGAVGLTRVLFEDKLVAKSCPCDPAGINSLDRWTAGYHSYGAGIAADATVYGVLVALPFIDLFDLGFGRALGEDVVVYLETLAVSTVIQNATNFVVARPRPRSYAADPAFIHSGEGYLSFYAGHVSTVAAGVTAAALTIRKRYGERVWPWIVGALVTSSIAFERVASGHHFPTDVGVAIVAGTAVGFAVPWLHYRRGETRLQIASFGARGLALVAAF